MIWLLLIFIWLPVQAKNAGPVYIHASNEQKEFEHLYKSTSASPAVSSGTGVPSETPNKIGDIYVNNSNGKVYIATATVTSGSWVIIN